MKRALAAAPRLRSAALACGTLASVAAVLAGTADPTHFFAAWLFAWLCVLGVALGALANVMIHELTGGEWGFVIRRALEAALATLPVIAALGVPLLFGLGRLYPWAAAQPSDALLAAKAWYLNTPFFIGRAVVYFMAWIGIAAALRRHWRAHRSNAGNVAAPAARALAVGGLIVYAVSMSLAATDWIVSLSRDWYSTGFGLYALTSQALCAFAFGVAASVACGALRNTSRAMPQDAMNEPASRARDAQDLGNVLLMYVMLWAYLAFTQFLVIWAEDLPSETSWYLTRATPGWKALAIVVLCLQFALPFCAMLFRRVKRDPGHLAALCAVVTGAGVLQVAWQVLPPFGDEPVWLPLLTLVGVGGLWLAAFTASYARTETARRAANGALDHG